MSAHTPGPWYVGIDKKSVWASVPKVGKEPCIAICPTSKHHQQDARLIAAAPALLEALERAINSCFDEYSFHAVMSDPAHFVNAAIRAAKEERNG